MKEKKKEEERGPGRKPEIRSSLYPHTLCSNFCSTSFFLSLFLWRNSHSREKRKERERRRRRKRVERVKNEVNRGFTSPLKSRDLVLERFFRERETQRERERNRLLVLSPEPKLNIVWILSFPHHHLLRITLFSFFLLFFFISFPRKRGKRGRKREKIESALFLVPEITITMMRSLMDTKKSTLSLSYFFLFSVFLHFVEREGKRKKKRENWFYYMVTKPGMTTFELFFDIFSLFLLFSFFLPFFLFLFSFPPHLVRKERERRKKRKSFLYHSSSALKESIRTRKYVRSLSNFSSFSLSSFSSLSLFFSFSSSLLRRRKRGVRILCPFPVSFHLPVLPPILSMFFIEFSPVLIELFQVLDSVQGSDKFPFLPSFLPWSNPNVLPFRSQFIPRILPIYSLLKY